MNFTIVKPGILEGYTLKKKLKGLFGLSDHIKR